MVTSRDLNTAAALLENSSDLGTALESQAKQKQQQE